MRKFILLLLMFCCLEVKAYEVSGSEVRGAYVRVVESGESIDLKVNLYEGSDGNYVYLLNPFEDDEEKLELSDSASYELLNEYMYYGYGYDGHDAKKWYVVTQVMIWREIYGDENVLFIDGIDGEIVSKYEEEIEEIEGLVEEGIVVPAIEGGVDYKKETSLQDETGVLSQYYVKEVLNGDARIVKGELRVTSEGVDAVRVVLGYESRFDEGMRVYSERFIVPGKLDDEDVSYEFDVVYGMLDVVFNDERVVCSECESVSYKVYDSKGSGIWEVGLESERVVLATGDYVLKEVKRDAGYVVNDEVYEFSVREDEVSKLVVNLKRVKNEVVIDKYNGKVLDERAIFEIKDSNGEVVFEGSVKESWKGVLGYGDYYVKVSSQSKGFSDEEIVVKVRSDGKVQSKKIVSEFDDSYYEIPDTSKGSYGLSFWLLILGCLGVKFGKK